MKNGINSRSTEVRVSATAPFSMMTPADQAGRVAAVILNKVRNLDWYYFDWDLRRDFQLDLNKQRPNMAVLARIEDHRVEDRSSRYKWIGTEEEKKDLLSCVLSVLRNNPETSLLLFQRIFDMNEIPDSWANQFPLKTLNKIVHWFRDTRYAASVRAKNYKSRTTIVAEGDSWFQFPLPGVLKDIVRQFESDNNYSVSTLAAGGDWLSTMLQSSEYLTELSRLKPDVFLFSGGGNDLTTDGRVGFIVRKKDEQLTPEFESLISRVYEKHRHLVPDKQDAYQRGLRCFTWEFFSLGNLMALEYLLLAQNFAHTKLANTIVITHGYDYMIPAPRSNARWWQLIRWFVNYWLEGTGRWLWIPMHEKHLSEEDKKDAVVAIITEFNAILMNMANNVNGGRNPFFHVDCRGTAPTKDDWFDEIHLSSKRFAEVKQSFSLLIQHLNGKPRWYEHGFNHEEKVFNQGSFAKMASEADLRPPQSLRSRS